MPNKWTGKGNPYTKQEVRDRLQKVVDEKKAIIAAGAGTGISAKFIEKGGCGPDYYIQLRSVPNVGPRLDGGHDGLWRCQCRSYGDRRVRGTAGR